jgi:hypothetical protein
MAMVHLADGSRVYLASQNRGRLLAFSQTAKLPATLKKVPANFSSVVMKNPDGKETKVELASRSGFLSNSGGFIALPEGASLFGVNGKGERVALDE